MLANICNALFIRRRIYPINFTEKSIIEIWKPAVKRLYGFNEISETEYNNIQGIFHHHVKENTYVPQKTKCPSLGAILIPAYNIEFFTKDGKLRARITDYSKQTYELKVSCKYLRDIFEKDKDVTSLNNAVTASQYAHCRIGLARKFLMQENHCYLMLNGLFLY